MILIFSEPQDTATTKTTEWLENKSAKFIRIDSITNLSFKYEISERKEICCLINKNKCTIKLSNIGAIWARRIPVGQLTEKINIKYNSVRECLINSVIREECAVLDLLQELLFDRFWLGSINTVSINKMKQLKKAKQLSIKFPQTSIVCKKKDVLQFYYSNNKNIIAKAIQDVYGFSIDNISYIPFTIQLDINAIKSMPKTFFPILLQERIDKLMEIRSFYLMGDFYSIAILSQNDERTKIDFRNYNYDNPNRRIPFELADDIKKTLDSFMKSLNLNTGSLDIILTPSYEYYLLEVNPVGQFGMVSYPGNFHIEEKIADLLISKDKEYGKAQKNIK
ncbi:MAG: grasp-with-spasm system ATP-grasp peptide maturase [Bacteroidales bacterium]|jgi:ATP-GRASP peptide maturase of grasp-with-spasm system|nr:grasp-with-spasm system ATP-grasp peptide maturase [Bacteroidales bacterium]